MMSEYNCKTQLNRFLHFSLGKANDSKAQMNNDSPSTSAPGWDQGSDYPGGLYYVDHAHSK